MYTLYYVLMAIGMLALVGSLFGGDADGGFDVDLDGDIDVDVDSSDSASVFSMRTIAAGFMAFGIGALIMANNGYSSLWQIVVGSGSAFGMGYLTYLFTKFLYSFQGHTNLSLSGVMGKAGIITIGTAQNGKAQLRVDTNNGPREFTCKEVNDKKLKISDNVTISDKVGNLLLVTK